MYIRNPKTNKRIFLDNSISAYEDRLKEVQERIFADSSLMQYFRDNNRIKNLLQINSYYKATSLLERISTYLLMGMYKDNNIMTLHKIRQYIDKEIPESNTATNAGDLMYGGSDGEESVVNVARTELTADGDTAQDILNMPSREIARRKRKEKKNVAKYKNSKTFKFEQIHSTRPLVTYRLKQVRNNDNTYDVGKVTEDGSVVITGKKTVDENDKSFSKNAFGQPVFNVEYLTIGGREGLIKLGQRYDFKWATVDTDNQFEFLGNRYEIAKSVKQYKVNKDNQCEMDKILCYYVHDTGRFYWFNQNVEEISGIYITQVFNAQVQH